MKTNTYVLAILLCSLGYAQVSFGQLYSMPTGNPVTATANTCSGTFVDNNAGINGNYTDNQESRYIFCPTNPNLRIRATFTSFETEFGFDELWVIQGPTDFGQPPSGSQQRFWSTDSPGVQTSTHPTGCLTFYFSSDNSVTKPGWEATIDCVPCSQPVAACKNATVQLDGNGNAPVPASAVDNGSTTDCALQSAVVSPASFGCGQVGNQTVTLTITDANNNNTACVSTVTVEDNIPHGISCPPNTTVELGNSTDPSATGTAIATDNCGSPMITVSDQVTNTGACPIVQIVDRTWTATANGVPVSCVQTIEITDQTPPTITCPDPVTIEWPAGFNLDPVPQDQPQDPSVHPDVTGHPTVSDNAGIQSVSFQDVLIGPNPNNCPFIWRIDRTWTVTDVCGLTATCVQFLNFTDNTAPAINCPSDLTIEWGDPEDPSATGNPTATDNCDTNPVLTFTQNVITTGACPIVRIVERTFMATDDCGNQSSCLQIISVTDLTPPTIICPPPLTFEWPAGFNLNPVPPNVPQDPSIDPGITGNPITNDNRGVIDVSFQDVLIGPNPNNCPNLWTVERTWTVKDFCDLTTTCVQIFTFTDMTPPSIICPPPLTLEWPPNFNLNPVPLNVPQDPSVDPAITGNPITNDNCGVADVSFQDVLIGPNPNNCPFLWRLDRTWTVTDFCGLTAVCVQTLNFTDMTPPTIICPPDLTLEWPPGFNLNPVPLNVPQDPSIDPAITGNPVTNDNCGVADITYQDILIGPDPFNCPFLWTVIRTWIVTDFCDLTASCVQIFFFTDTTPPTALCQSFTVLIQANETGSVMANDVDAGSTDNCGTPSLSLSGTSIFDCDDIGMNFNVTLTTTDNCNLTNSCVASVSVADPDSYCCIGPVAMCMDATIALDGNGDATADPSLVSAGSTADCGLASETVMPSDFDCMDIGPNTVTYTITDINGASSTCTAVLTVEDNVQPSISCPPDAVFFTDQGDCEATITVPTPTASDNCAVTVLRYRWRVVDENGDDIPGEGWSPWSTDVMQTLEAGFYKFQWQTKDASNNQRRCSFLVDIVDNEPPVAVCKDLTIQKTGGQETILTAEDVYNDLASTDNCGDPVLIGFSPSSITCDQLGLVIPVTVTVEDDNGNPGQCTANVTVGGLPCGWSADPDGINCAGGNQASYDPNTDTFIVTSEGCYDPNYYSSSDSHGFVGTQLCGDGEIIAEIVGVTGDGFAGLSMREDLSPGAKMLQLGIDGVSLTKREMRQSTGGIGFNHLFQTQGKNWLRLTRSGNQFTAQHSTDGMNWSSVIVVNISMSNCIEVGMYTENNTSTGVVIGTFANVEIKYSNTLSAPTNNGLDEVDWDVEPMVSIYPNPSEGEVFIDLSGYKGGNATIEVLNNLGQLVKQVRIVDIQFLTQRIDLGEHQSGLYFIKVKVADLPEVTRKLILVNE